MVYLALANRLSCKHLRVSRGSLVLGIAHGFTLVEFVLVAAISGIVLLVAASLSVNEARSAIRTYVYQSLRDQMARVTFLIEGEVAEASELSLFQPSVFSPATSCLAPLNLTLLFTFRHSYTQSQSGGYAIICYYRDDFSNLYRYGPKFDDQTGVLLPPTVAPSSLRLVSRRTYLDDVEVSQGVLKYRIRVGTVASGDGPIWNLSYAPTSLQVARVGSACMPSASTTSPGCW